jgi:serralysin
MATIVGTDQEDLLLGFSGADALYGLAGNDVLQGGAAADHLEGGPGFDLASYSEAPADFGVGGVRARLDDPSANSIEAAGDTYVSIEGLIGSQFWDTLAGDDQNHVLYGLAGRDSLFGLGGDDILNSAWVPTFWTEGPGFDFASYSEASTGVRASLADSSANGGEAVEFETFKPFQPRFDSYVDMEGLIGSRFDDVLVGDTQDNASYGLSGNDFLYGLDGLDTLSGDAEADILNGGAGADYLDGGGGLTSFGPAQRVGVRINMVRLPLAPGRRASP